ncbi:unnamed protein product [Prunus armeniaca]
MEASDRSEARTPQAIASRFKIINQQSSLWKACLIKANASPLSGSNLRDLWNNQNQAPTPTPRDSSHSGHTVNLEEDDDDVVMPTSKQLGRDKHKVAQNKGKSIEGNLNQSGKFLSELVQQRNELKEDRGES